MSCNKLKFGCTNIFVREMPRTLSTLEIRGKVVDIRLVSFTRGSMHQEADHIRVVLKSESLLKELVTRLLMEDRV